jgi:hypothetical protein
MTTAYMAAMLGVVTKEAKENHFDISPNMTVLMTSKTRVDPEFNHRQLTYTKTFNFFSLK